MNIQKALQIRNILLIIFLLIGQSTIAQTRSLVLQIDTLIKSDYNQDFYIKTQGHQYLRPYLVQDSFCNVDYRKHSLTCKLNIQNDSSTIRISLDQRGGYLELSNLSQLNSDTLSISKFVLYDRPYRDTNWTATNYWYKEADTLGENFKNTREYSVDKVKSKQLAPIKTQYEINGEIYSCTTSWLKKSSEVFTKFHGRGRTGLLKGRRHFYFHGTTRSTLTVNAIYIRLKNGL